MKDLIEHSLDSTPDYLSLTTPHFQIHYPTGFHELAQHVALGAEHAHRKVTQHLEWVPKGTIHVVLVHKSDRPENMAFVFPHKQIFLDAAIADYSLGMEEFTDWYETIITHELVHIVQMDYEEGIYQWLSPLFGSWLKPNRFAPRWMIEGLAVALETELTLKGRGTGDIYSMIFRSAVHDGYFDDPDFVSKTTFGNEKVKTWPWPDRAYLFGYQLVRTLGDQTQGDFSVIPKSIGTSLPFRMQPLIRRTGFQSFDEVWEKSLERLRTQAQNELKPILSKKLTAFERLTNTGFWYFGLAISPKGDRLAVTHDSPHSAKTIQLFEIEGDILSPSTKLMSRTTGTTLDFSDSGRFLLFDQSIVRSNNYLASDIMIYDFKASRVIAASDFYRARDANAHPNGKNIVFIANRLGKNLIVETDSNFGSPQVLVDSFGYSRLSLPRYSPDGSAIVFTSHNTETGGEDIWLFRNGQLISLVQNSFKNMTPSWDPSGQKLFFSSNMSGVFNLYCLDLQQKELHRLTNVVGGVFEPVPDPHRKWIYAVLFEARGFNVVRLRWDETTWEKVDAPLLRTSTTTIGRPLTQVNLRDITEEPVGFVNASTSSYSSWKYLKPQYMHPIFSLRPDSTQFGIRIGAVDPMYFNHYELDLLHDSQTGEPVGRLFYYNGESSAKLDFHLLRDAFYIEGLKTTARTLELDTGAHFLLRQKRHFRLRPGLTYESLDMNGPIEYYGPSLSLIYDTEFLETGHSFPESGTLVDLSLGQYFSRDSELDPATRVQLQYRNHFAGLARRHALHFDIEGGHYFNSQQSSSPYFLAGGVFAFPYSYSSRYELYGFKPNQFIASSLLKADLSYTLPLSDIQKESVRWRTRLGRLSARIRLQGSLLRYDNDEFQPTSYGVEFIQEILFGSVYDLTARFSLYQGDPEYGGESQVYFNLVGIPLSRETPTR